MAGEVAALLASGFVDIAKDKLGSAIAEQASLLWNFGVELEDMMDVFETISAVLEDAERRSVKEKLVQLWLKRLKDVALDISDLLEDCQDTSDQANAKVRSYYTLKDVSSSSPFIYFQPRCASEYFIRSGQVAEISTCGCMR